MVDNIGSAREVAALQNIAEQGVVVVATACGTTLQRLQDNSILSCLVGGKQAMAIGEHAAR